MNNKSLSKIAKEIYFRSSGCIDWKEMAIEYGLSEMEINYVANIIRNWNKK